MPSTENTCLPAGPGWEMILAAGDTSAQIGKHLSFLRVPCLLRGRTGAGTYPKVLLSPMGLGLAAEKLWCLMLCSGHFDCGIMSTVSPTGAQKDLSTLCLKKEASKTAGP